MADLSDRTEMGVLTLVDDWLVVARWICWEVGIDILQFCLLEICRMLSGAR